MGANQSRPTRRAAGSRHKTYPSAHGRTYSEPPMSRGNYGWPHAPELPQAQMQAIYQNMGMPMYNGGYAAPPPPQFGLYQPQPSQMSGYAPVHYPQPSQSQPPQQQQYYNQQPNQPQQYYEQPTQSQSQQYYAAPPPPPVVSQPQSQPPQQPVIPPPPQMSQIPTQAPIFAPFRQPGQAFQPPAPEPIQAPAPPPPIVSQPRQPSPPAPPPPPQPAPPPPSVSAPPFPANPIHRPPLYEIPPALRYDEPHSGHTPLRNPLPEPPRDVFDDPRFAALRDHQWEREAADIGISPEALYTVKEIPASTSSASGHTRAASASTASDMHHKKGSGGGFFSTLARVGTKKKKDKGKERVEAQAPTPSPANSDNPAIPVKWTFRTGVQPSSSDPIPVINPPLQPPVPPQVAVSRSNYSDRHHDSPRSNSSHSPTPPGSPPQGPGPEPTPFPGGYSGPLNSAPFSTNDINPETGLPKGFIPTGPPSAGPPPSAPLASPMNGHQSEQTGSSSDWYRPTSPQVRSPQMRSPQLSSPLLTASPMPLPIPAPFEHGGHGGSPSMPFSSHVFPHMMRLAFASDHPIIYSDQVWPTAAHLLESMKFTPTESGPELPPDGRALLPELREAVRRCKTVEDVQDFVSGASDWVRSDWAEVAPHKADEVLWYKLNQYRELRGLLNGTGDHELLYVDPNDLFWGAADAGGRNELGKALMRARDTFREGSEVGRR